MQCYKKCACCYVKEGCKSFSTWCNVSTESCRCIYIWLKKIKINTRTRMHWGTAALYSLWVML